MAKQQELRKELLRRYPEVFPSSYAPIVETDRETTYRFFVRKNEWDASTMVEVPVRKGRK